MSKPIKYDAWENDSWTKDPGISDQDKIEYWEKENGSLRQQNAELKEGIRYLKKFIFEKTNLCLYGGGLNGERTSCEFGHPGCECDDNIQALSPNGENDSESTG